MAVDKTKEQLDKFVGEMRETVWDNMESAEK